jgi:hypothetical protein
MEAAATRLSARSACSGASERAGARPDAAQGWPTIRRRALNRLRVEAAAREGDTVERSL